MIVGWRQASAYVPDHIFPDYDRSNAWSEHASSAIPQDESSSLQSCCQSGSMEGTECPLPTAVFYMAANANHSNH